MKCLNITSPNGYHLIGLYYDSLSNIEEHIYTNHGEIEKYLTYENFTRFNFCPYCGEEL